MKKFLLLLSTGCSSLFSFSQQIDKVINLSEVERIERILSADDMMGRKTFTLGIDKAADFIAQEFSATQLKYFGTQKSFFQEFEMVKAKPLEIKGLLDGDSLNTSNVAANTTQAEINISKLSDFQIEIVKKEDDFSSKVFPLFDLNKNLLVLIDTAHVKRFKGMQRFAGNAKFTANVSQIFILTTHLNPSSIDLHIKNQLNTQSLKNVVGYLPGKKSQPNM
jgi:hypothetical protein